MTTPSDGELKLVDWRAVSRVLSDTPAPKRLPAPQTRSVWEAERRELYKRKLDMEMEAIRLYEPVLLGQEVHRSMAVWNILDGANRACLAGEQKIYDPITKKSQRIDHINRVFHVHSINPETGEIEVHKASKPFIKAWGELYRFTFSNGKTLCASMEHCVVAADGQWISMVSAFENKTFLAESHDAQVPHKTYRPSHEEDQEFQKPKVVRINFVDIHPCSAIIATDAALLKHRLHETTVPLRHYHNRTVSQFQKLLTYGQTTGRAILQQKAQESSWLLEFVASHPHSSSGTYQQAHLKGDRYSTRITPNYSRNYFRDRRPNGELPRSVQDTDLNAFPLRDDVLEHIHYDWLADGSQRTVRYSHVDPLSLHPSNQGVHHQEAAHFHDAQSPACSLSEVSVCESNCTFDQSHEPATDLHSTTDEALLRPEDSQSFVSSHPPLFHGINSSVNCTRVEYLGQGPIWDISVEPYANYVAGGLINANCKSVTGSSEAAYALLGCHPHGKYVKRNGLAWFVGLKEKHLILMYDSLFREGAFRVIRDEHTKLWRTMRWDRNNPTQLQAYDEAYREKSRPAPPLIPKRMITTDSMADKAKGIPGVHVLSNGWKIIWSPGGGEPEQGQHWNLVWFDEEMTNPEFYKEAHRGLTKLAHETELEKPRGLWSATSQVSNPELAELREKADKDPDSKFVRRFTFLISDNPYVSEADRATFKEGLSEDDIATRYEGIPASTYRRIYSSYSPMGPHGVESFDIPLDWCIWAVTDPGRVRCATIFDTVDPDQGYHTVYGGFEVRNGNAHEWAAEMKKHETKMGRRFQGIIFDQMRGRQTLDSLWSQTVAEQYWTALLQAGVTPISCGNVKGMGGFYPGLNNVEARERAFINMLAIRNDGPFEGTSRFRVVRGAVPMLDKQIVQAHTDPKNPEKRYKDKSQPSDWIECGEYLAAFNPSYHAPEVPTEIPVSRAFDDFKKKKKRDARRALAGQLY